MSNYARIAAQYIAAHCQLTFKDGKRMESPFTQGGYLDCFDITSTGSHKYIPADKLTLDLGMQIGAGVYNYAKFSDGTYLLFTCDGGVAWWTGKADEKAQWADRPRAELI